MRGRAGEWAGEWVRVSGWRWREGGYLWRDKVLGEAVLVLGAVVEEAEDGHGEQRAAGGLEWAKGGSE